MRQRFRQGGLSMIGFLFVAAVVVTCVMADAGYIESVSGKDVDVVKTRNEVTASITWSRKLPLVANVSLWLDFDASVTL